MSAALAFKCPGTGEVVRPVGGKCPICGAAKMRGHLRLVGREWVLDPDRESAPLAVVTPSPVIEFQAPSRTKRQIVTPGLLRRYHAAREWLVPRESELLATGWTRAGLYRINRPLGSTYGWGVAWSMWWIETNVTPAMGAGGQIEFHTREHDSRVNVLVAQPR